MKKERYFVNELEVNKFTFMLSMIENLVKQSNIKNTLDTRNRLFKEVELVVHNELKKKETSMIRLDFMHVYQIYKVSDTEMENK